MLPEITGKVFAPPLPFFGSPFPGFRHSFAIHSEQKRLLAVARHRSYFRFGKVFNIMTYDENRIFEKAQEGSRSHTQTTNSGSLLNLIHPRIHR
ncbi:hypothetical protein TNCV_2809571 [Trichonephila clavipes]|nr:hypothetical protein TNCV_2809571 [Trichonephila clavipes]